MLTVQVLPTRKATPSHTGRAEGISSTRTQLCRFKHRIEELFGKPRILLQNPIIFHVCMRGVGKISAQQNTERWVRLCLEVTT